MSSPLSWRDIASIPGLIPHDEIKIRDNIDEAVFGASSEAKSASPHKLDGACVAIIWRSQSGLNWHVYRVVKVARVYGETHLLLEMGDESRSWASLSNIRFIRNVESQ